MVVKDGLDSSLARHRAGFAAAGSKNGGSLDSLSFYGAHFPSFPSPALISQI